MNEEFTLSAKGAALVKSFESCLQAAGPGTFKPYICPAGVLTIGWGHTNHHGRSFDAGSIWTQEECDAAFLEDMHHFEQRVRNLVKVQLDQDQFDALVSFAYNCGEGNLRASTLLKKVNAGEFESAAHEFHKWNKGNGKVLAGLVRRRGCEALLFQGIPDVNYDGKPDQLMAHKVEGHASATG
jgi:lysozyme